MPHDMSQKDKKRISNYFDEMERYEKYEENEKETQKKAKTKPVDLFKGFGSIKFKNAKQKPFAYSDIQRVTRGLYRR